jgi:hypothetical protein
MDLLDEEIKVYLSVIFDNELATEYELDKEICFKQYFHTNEGNKFNKILVAWDIPKDITNNQQGYTGKFTLSLKVERFVGGVVTKRWVTSPFADLAIGSSLILHDINSFISRDEQALQKAVE